MLSFTFKGTSSVSKDILVQEIRRDILPPITMETLETAAHGAQLIDKKYGPRQIEVDIHISNQANFRAKVRELAAWLNSLEEQDLVFSDEDDKKYLATLDGSTNLNEIARTGKGTLIFFCPSPFAISLTKKTVNPTANATTNHTYAGTETAFPIITCTFTTAKTNYTLKNTVPDGTINQIDLTYSFPSGAVLVVDMHEGSIKVNGTDSPQIMNLSTPDYWGLENGINQLWFPTGATIKVEYYERWL